jgi:hypothetical protein
MSDPNNINNLSDLAHNNPLPIASCFRYPVLHLYTVLPALVFGFRDQQFYISVLIKKWFVHQELQISGNQEKWHLIPVF